MGVLPDVPVGLTASAVRLEEVAESGSRVDVDLEDLDLLRLESDTWDLLQQLTSCVPVVYRRILG